MVITGPDISCYYLPFLSPSEVQVLLAHSQTPEYKCPKVCIFTLIVSIGCPTVTTASPEITDYT